MNDFSADHVELPRTAYLTHTLRRAKTAAEQRSHRYVLLEHLLFALLDDPDALALLQALGADVAVIRSLISDAVNHRMSSLIASGGGSPSFSHKFDSLMASASEQAIRAGRSQVDGAFALVALANDAESNASVFLLRNGFDLAGAIRHLGIDAGPEKRNASLRPARPAEHSSGGGFRDDPASSGPVLGMRATPPFSEAPRRAPGLRTDGDIDDVLESVRELLQSEERNAQTREPQLSMMPPAGPSGQEQNRRDPSLPLPSGTGRRVQLDPRSEATLEVGGAALRVEPLPQASGKGKGTKSKRLKAAPAQHNALLAKLSETIPGRMRVALPRTVEVRLSKEEATVLFQGVKARGQARGGAAEVSRAVTVRVSAPEGGFFIETLTPETQWAYDRPSFLGEESFGRWAWTLIPNERGRHQLRVLVSSHAIDENGLAANATLPEQVLGIRVGPNYFRMFGQLFKTVLVLCAGGGLTEGAIYLLKMFGKLPH